MSAPRATPLNGGYDQNLLAVTPEVSKAARQEGYNVDLLREDGLPPQRNTAHRSIDPENGGQYHAQPLYTKENYSGPVKPQKIPWWRTQNGIIAIVIILIVIIGAIVGGAVGGSVSHKGKTVVVEQPVTNSSSVPAVDGSKPDDKKSPDSGGPVVIDSSKEAQNTNSAPPTSSASPNAEPTPGTIIRRAW